MQGFAVMPKEDDHFQGHENIKDCPLIVSLGLFRVEKVFFAH